MNTKPVTQKVIMIVASIAPQLEASGVNHQGLQKWKMTDPTTITIKTIASAMLLSFSLLAIDEHCCKHNQHPGN